MAQNKDLDLLRTLRAETQDEQPEQVPQRPIDNRDDDPHRTRHDDRRPYRLTCSPRRARHSFADHRRSEFPAPSRVRWQARLGPVVLRLLLRSPDDRPEYACRGVSAEAGVGDRAAPHGAEFGRRLHVVELDRRQHRRSRMPVHLVERTKPPREFSTSWLISAMISSRVCASSLAGAHGSSRHGSGGIVFSSSVATREL